VSTKLYHTQGGVVLDQDGTQYRLPGTTWDDIINLPELWISLERHAREKIERLDSLLPPIQSQEVWAAGVTYFRSLDARMEEIRQAGSGSEDFYDKVYTAPRPELFFKATPHRVVGPGAAVRIRRDSKWNVPEPELALVINASGQIIGYTIGNDMSSRDIEGENPLYLPQAKVWDKSCALGPCVLVSDEPLPKTSKIELAIARGGKPCFSGSATLEQMKRSPHELVEFLYRECSFPSGCVLLTGTGIVPPAEFTLAAGDEIAITIEGIGTLKNHVEAAR
jgi:2-dehydro-3-deoxy-D-arabinonate dehydratase